MNMLIWWDYANFIPLYTYIKSSHCILRIMYHNFVNYTTKI